MPFVPVNPAGIVAYAQQQEKLALQQEHACNAFKASAAFRSGLSDAEDYLDRAYGEAQLAKQAGESALALDFRSARTLWLKKRKPTESQRAGADTAARGLLRDQFLEATHDRNFTVAWHAARHPAALAGRMEWDKEYVDGLSDDALYRIGFAARLGRASDILARMDEAFLAESRPKPERGFLQRALRQRGDQLREKLEQDARLAPDVLKSRPSSGP